MGEWTAKGWHGMMGTEPFQKEMSRALGVRVQWNGVIVERRLTQMQFSQKYPYQGQVRPHRCVNDVMDTLEGITASVSRSTNPSYEAKEMAALAADALGLLAVYMLTIHTGQESSEVSFARLVTRLFAKYGMTPKSLKILRDTLELSLRYEPSDESR